MPDIKAIKFSITLISLLLIFLGILIVGNTSLFEILFFYILILVMGIFVFNSKQFRRDLITFDKKNLKSSAFQGVIFGGLFFLLTKIVPGASIGLPLLPQSISQYFIKSSFLVAKR